MGRGPVGSEKGSGVECQEAPAGSGELCAAAAGPTGATWTTGETVFKCTCSSCFRAALGSASEPHGATNLCNLIITLAQPSKDELLTLAGLAEAR